MFEKIIIALVVAILLPLISYAVTTLTQYVKAKANEIENENVRFFVKEAMDRVEKAVLYVMQTYTDTLKKESKFDKDAQAEALRRAKERAYELIDSDMQAIVEKAYGDFDVWLESSIEETVRWTK